MLNPTAALRRLDRKYAREILAPMSYHAALARFAALWSEARTLNPDFTSDWREDIRPDLTLARVLNGLGVTS